MKRPSSLPKKALVLSCAWLALLAASAAKAQTAPLADASVADFERALAAPDGPATKGFRYTAPPDTQHRCAGGPAKEGEGPNSKTLEVVYGDDTAPQAQMALRFGYNSDELTSSDRTMLDRLAQALNGAQLRDGRFAIAGHTDRSGDETRTGYDNNRRLSCARAIRVVEYLVKTRRVAADRLSAYGFGSDKLLTGFGPNAPQHRRVEIRRAD